MTNDIVLINGAFWCAVVAAESLPVAVLDIMTLLYFGEVVAENLSG